VFAETSQLKLLFAFCKKFPTYDGLIDVVEIFDSEVFLATWSCCELTTINAKKAILQRTS